MMTTPGNKYLRAIAGKKEITLPDGRKEVMRVYVKVDIYDVINAWDITDPALQHALKKLIQPGERGGKTFAQDLKEAIYSIERCLENTRPETVLLNDELNIVAEVIPKAPTFHNAQNGPRTEAVPPTLPVQPFYHGAGGALLYGKLLNNRSRVQRIKFHQNDTIWRNFCKKHNIAVDAIFTVAEVQGAAKRIFLDVETDYEWDAIKFNVV